MTIPNTDFELLYNNLQWNTYTFACFRSPSNGIKLIIQYRYARR